jgi:hypothetical protein
LQTFRRFYLGAKACTLSSSRIICLFCTGLLFTWQFRRFGGAQLFHQHPFRCAFQIYTRIMDRRLLLRAKRFDKIGHTEAAGGARF